MVKIKVRGHPEIKISPFAFSSEFTSLNIMENPTEEVLEECMPYNESTVYDCENNQYLVLSKSVMEDGNVVVELSLKDS